MTLRIREAALGDSGDAKSIVAVLNAYAIDPMGGGHALSSDVCERLVPALREHPTSLVLLAFVDDEPAGIAICFYGLSTFRARPLLNIHDLAVLPKYRGKGIGSALLQATEEHARLKGCCKLTLEVRDDNTSARAVYRRFGFEDFVGGESASMRFLAKPLEA